MENRKNLSDFTNLLKEWDYSKNKNLDPKNILYRSDKKVWWVCSVCSFEWNAVVKSRTKGCGCPKCAGKIVTKEKSLESTHSHLIEEWADKNILKPNQVTFGSERKIFWICKKCNYEWQAAVNKRVGGRGCPKCAGKVVTSDNCLEATHPHLIKEWSERNILKPNQVTFGSDKKVWWKCGKCNYEWQTAVKNRTFFKTGCIQCSRRVVTEKNCLRATHPDLIKWWSDKNTLTPDQVTFGSLKKAWWKCPNCSFEWKMIIRNRVFSNRSCARCSNNIVTEQNCLKNVAPWICEQWSDKNELKPEYVSYGSLKKAWWRCNKCNNEWYTEIRRRVYTKSGCPFCGLGNSVSKESIKWLDSLNIPANCREKTIIIKNTRFVVDAYIEETNTIYEYFGNFWHGNLEIYNKHDINPRTKTTYGYLYNKTIERIKIFKDNGFNLIFIWGH